MACLLLQKWVNTSPAVQSCWWPKWMNVQRLFPPLPPAGWSHLWPCAAMSRARRTGTGEPPSVTLSTSMDFLSGLRLPWRLSMGESTRFLGGSADGWQGSEVSEQRR